VNKLAISQIELNCIVDALAERLELRMTDSLGDQVGDVNDAARWLKCSVPTIERAVRDGQIPSFKVGRLRRFRRADLMAMSEKGGCDHGK